MSEKKKEAARKIARGLSDWDPAEPCAFEASSGAEFRLGPLSLITVGKRHRLLINGVDYTEEMSDALGLGLRGEGDDGVPYKTFSGGPQRELAEWTLRACQELAADTPEPSVDSISQAIRSGKLKARLIASVAGFVGHSASKSPDGAYERDLAELVRSSGADVSAWSLNRKRFERGLMESSPNWAEAFFETAAKASPRALTDLALMASQGEWRGTAQRCESLALRLADMGCALTTGQNRASELFESVGMGSLAALLEAKDIRQSLGEKVAAPQRGKTL